MSAEVRKSFLRRCCLNPNSRGAGFGARLPSEVLVRMLILINVEDIIGKRELDANSRSTAVSPLGFCVKFFLVWE